MSWRKASRKRASGVGAQPNLVRARGKGVRMMMSRSHAVMYVCLLGENEVVRSYVGFHVSTALSLVSPHVIVFTRHHAKSTCSLSLSLHTARADVVSP